MQQDENEEKLLRSVALQNAKAVFRAREVAERQLVEANQRITNILESITDGFVAFDRDWKIIYINARGAELVRPLHASRESLIGQSHWEAFPESVGTNIEDNYRRAMRDQVTVHFENFYPPLNTWFDIRAYPSPHGLSVYFQDVTERKRSSAILDEQREWLAVTLRSIGDGVIATDNAGKVTFLNSVAENMTGWKSEEAAGRSIDEVFQLIHEQTQKPVEAPIHTVFREKRIVGLANHTVLISAVGKSTAIEDSAAPILDPQGNMTGAVMVFHDVTERRRSELALRRSEERWRGIFTHAAVGIATAGLDGRFIEVNPRFAQILNYTPEELLSLSPAQITHPDDRAQTHALMQKLVADEIQHYSLEKRYRRKDGSHVWGLATITLVRDENGYPQHFVGIVEDISQRKQAEDEVRLGRERLELALEAGGLGDWDWDAVTDIVTVGPRAKAIFGLGSSAITWTDLRELLHPNDRERARVAVEKSLNDRSNYQIEYRVLRPNGESVWVAARGRGRYDSSGIIIGMSGVVVDVTARRRADEVRFRLAAVVESSDDAIISMDLLATITTWNQGAERMFGYSAAEIIGQPVMVLLPEGRQNEEPAIIQRLLRGERIEHYETVRLRKDGVPIDVSLSVSPILDSEGQIVGASKISRDITARRQTEEKLRRSEEELRALANSIPQLAWMAEPDGHIFWFNERWYEYTGTTFEQMQGWGWQSLHDPKILPDVIVRWKHSLNTGEPFDMEFPLRGADGVFRWFLTRVNPVRDSNGRIARWFGTNTDVDTVRRAQEALREETRILELLNDTGKAIAAQLDLQKVVQIVTDAATKLCGAKFGAFFYNVVNQQGESLVLFTLSGAPREAFERFGHPRATPLFGPTFRGEGIIRCDDVLKDPRYGQVSPHHGMPSGHLPVRSYLAVPVISRTGEVIGGLFFGHPAPGVFTDRSERLIGGVAAQAAIAIDNARLFESAQRELAERQRVAEELRQAQAELSRHAGELEQQVAARTASLREALGQLEEFSYSVSHDLRAPIRAIAGYTKIFQNDYGDLVPPQGKVYLDKISRSTHRMERLVNDVLTMSRVARADIQLHSISIQPFVEEIIEQHPSMQEPAATITVTTPHSLVADDASLNQALSNLLTNAIKFMPAGQKPVIHVRSERRADRVRIWIEDNGIGIQPQHRSKLFGMFQRLPADLQYEGSGIGLAIVRKAVERMGGTVGMESNHPTGSRFWIEIKGAQ